MTTFALNISEAKKNQNQMAHNLNPHNHLVVYTKKVEINSKIVAETVFSTQKIVCKVFFGQDHILLSTPASQRGVLDLQEYFILN